MNRSGLRALTVVIAALMAVVPFLGLDDLPRNLRSQIDAERTALASTSAQIGHAKEEVARELQSDADIFRTVPASQHWPDELANTQTALVSANRTMQQLSALEKANRRQDREQAQKLLNDERQVRTSALREAAGVQNEASHWVDLKRHLPDELQRMERNYRDIQAFDLGAVNAAAQRAEGDWPDKKSDLEARLASIRGLQTQADETWQSSAELRKAAAAGDFAHLDFGALVNAQNTLQNDAAQLPQKANELNALTGQLYNTWDKILVDMEQRGHGRSRTYDQKIRTVTTHLPDAAAKSGQTTSDEKWVEVSEPTYKAMQNNLGMAIEHKPAGKYDFEADRVAQPAGFAYVAPPGQSNQYGYWQHSGGHDFWVFYGQYALLRDLLFNHDYRPLDRYEWEDYRNYQRTGRTYYGHDESASAPKYGSQGTATAGRYSNSTFAKGGGFRNSQYASKSGNYRNSPFSTPGARDPNADHAPRRFGSGSSSGPQAAPRYRPSPRPSFRPPSTGRSFGRRR